MPPHEDETSAAGRFIRSKLVKRKLHDHSLVFSAARGGDRAGRRAASPRSCCPAPSEAWRASIGGTVGNITGPVLGRTGGDSSGAGSNLVGGAFDRVSSALLIRRRTGRHIARPAPAAAVAAGRMRTAASWRATATTMSFGATAWWRSIPTPRASPRHRAPGSGSSRTSPKPALACASSRSRSPAG